MAMVRAIDALQHGFDALSSGSWAEARQAFETALAAEETPEAFEGFGMAAWWLDDAQSVFEARDRAYRLYRQRRDAQGAARVAVALAEDSLYIRGEAAVAGL
jgi:LuxR family transcriptional regulator, maltose regulon positive regulatory protein